MKKQIRLVLSALLIILAGCANQSIKETAIYEQEAASVIEDFMKLLDQGNYQEAYDKGGTQVKEWTTSERSQIWFNINRGPMGKTLERELQKISYKTEYPGKPDGHYVEAIYKTKFENKKTPAHERVIASKDGTTWKIRHYVIR